MHFGGMVLVRLVCFVHRLLWKSSQSGQPLPNVVEEKRGKGIAHLHVILRQTRPIGCNSDAGGNLQKLLSAVDDDVAELHVVADIEIQGRVHRNEESNVAIQRDF